MSTKFCLIGFGEAAQAFTASAGWAGTTCGYDIKLDAPEQAGLLREIYKSCGVNACPSNAAAVTGASMIASLVTADQSLEAARETAAHLTNGAVFFDMNSVSPARKQAAARLIEDAGGSYADVAIMAPVQPAAMNVPLLVSGRDADHAVASLKSLGFSNVRAVGEKVGEASAIKMIRSVMVKGIEALTAECLIAAESAGVTQSVLRSLGDDWAGRADYNLGRMLVHGVRRACEMDEVCATLASLGVEPVLSRAAMSRQRELGAIGAGHAPGGLAEKLRLIRSQRKDG